MRPVGSLAAGLVALALLTGCSGDGSGPDVPTRVPATPAAAPAPAVPPAGRTALAGSSYTLLAAEPGSGLLAAAAGTRLDVLDPADDPVAVARTLTLPGAAAALVPGRPGELLAAVPGAVVRVEPATGASTEVPVDGDVRSVSPGPDGTLVVGTADGQVRTLGPDGAVRAAADGLVTADALAVIGGEVAVLDRHQSLIAELDTGADRLGLRLRAGDGATTLIADAQGRVLVTDPEHGELLVYTTAPLVLRQRFPVGSSPYAVAYDAGSDTVWVSCTQSNEVVGFDLGTGIPVEVDRRPTVRQPDALAVDAGTGDLFVASAAGGGVQRIAATDRKRGQ
ncbi:YncE family protein [Nocardia sp. NPDC057353]|uniref:YncE family protein n=1 Tax=Nocardia sp. NPDC057353 TaxID=3346104 RepID=UPI00363457E3